MCGNSYFSLFLYLVFLILPFFFLELVLYNGKKKTFSYQKLLPLYVTCNKFLFHFPSLLLHYFIGICSCKTDCYIIFSGDLWLLMIFFVFRYSQYDRCYNRYSSKSGWWHWSNQAPSNFGESSFIILSKNSIMEEKDQKEKRKTNCVLTVAVIL